MITDNADNRPTEPVEDRPADEAIELQQTDEEPVEDRPSDKQTEPAEHRPADGAIQLQQADEGPSRTELNGRYM